MTYALGVLLAALALPAHAATVQCFEPWTITCVTSIEKQKAYLLPLLDDAKFVHMTYLVLLFRPIDTAGFNFYLDQLKKGLKTREQVVDEVISSAEYKSLHQVPVPPDVWSGRCEGFAHTRAMTWDWAQTMSHIDAGGLSVDAMLVISFVPSYPADVNNMASISATGYPAPNMINYMTLAISAKPCDLNPPAPGVSSSTTPSVPYGIGTVGKYWATGEPFGVELQPGRTYYINVANGRDGAGARTCINPPPGWNCDARVSLQKPLGH